MKGSDVTQVGYPFSGPYLGKGAIVVKDNMSPPAYMWVGVGDTVLPTMGKSNVRIQSGPGVFTPDFWEASYQTAAYYVLVHSKQLTNGSMFTIGQVNALDAMGTTLDDTTYTGDTMGYDGIQFSLLSQDAMGNSYISWTLWGAGPKLFSSIASARRIRGSASASRLVPWSSVARLLRPMATFG